ncbi:hypothetical protein [Streptomyces sp. NPDC093105]|uniref:hypothetical protein n=1 Tax=Streptomyces sp. NPDC093105 TaxID=3366029 RepID=UPI0037F30F70
MLASLGQEELAADWRASAAGPVDQVDPAGFGSSGPPSRLRRRVLDALAASPHRRRLLDVPTPDEIGRALTAMGRTALVYLAPGGGATLIVDARGTVTSLDLPELRADAPDLTAYHQMDAPGRDAGGPPETPPPLPFSWLRNGVSGLRVRHDFPPLLLMIRGVVSPGPEASTDR